MPHDPPPRALPNLSRRLHPGRRGDDRRGCLACRNLRGKPMPEFILDHGSIEATKAFAALDEFTRGYIEAAFFTSTGHLEDGDLEHATVAELAAETLERIIQDCATFQANHREDLDEATDNGRINGYDETGTGRDFWYSRNGHGAGYFDRQLGDIGDVLQDAARSWPNVDLYRGDDGLLYLA